MGGLGSATDSADGPSITPLTCHCSHAGSCHAWFRAILLLPRPQLIWLAFICHLPCQTQLVSSHNSPLPQILTLKKTCSKFLFDLLIARNCLNLLLKLTERYVCTHTRHVLIQHMAQNFESLLEEGALWQLPCGVWEEILIQDCLAVSC